MQNTLMINNYSLTLRKRICLIAVAILSFVCLTPSIRAVASELGGYIVDYLHANNQVASAVEVLCDTDFVARNNEFQTMAKDIAMQVVAMNPKDVPELLAQEFIKDPSLTVAELVKTISGKVGEKLVVNRFSRMQVGESKA